jgi:glycosyltransferase involved in cell wall biosynthesis
MRIVVDLQGAQQDIRSGGDGDDSVQLAKGLATCADVDVFVVINGLFAKEALAIRKALKNNVVPEKIHTWTPPEIPAGSSWHQQVGNLIRESVILSLAPEVILVPGDISRNGKGMAFSVGLPSSRVITIASRSTIALASASDQYLFELDAFDGRVLSLRQRVEAIINFCKAKINAASALDDLLESGKRPKLAFVSPLPPEKNGIASYSTELIPALTQYYDVDVIVDQESITNSWVTDNCGVFTPDHLIKNRKLYERIIYNFGNSPYHAYMYDLLDRVTGVVVLHDFYLGDLAYYIQHKKGDGAWFSKTLYTSHGYSAVVDYANNPNSVAIKKYPSNFDLFQKSRNIIVHSKSAIDLAENYYSKFESTKCYPIPLLRKPASVSHKTVARNNLKLGLQDFVVCSFGLMGQHKLNLRLIEAWLSSALAAQRECKLIFVGELPDNRFGASILDSIKDRVNIAITGWVDDETYRNYLIAADLAVQLRSESRGETSAAVLDCMNYGLATIVNSSGSMAELSGDDVVLLQHDHDSDELSENLRSELERLWRNEPERQSIGARAARTIRSKHSPQHCARQYAEIIERDRRLSLSNYKSLLSKMARLGQPPIGVDERFEIAERLSQSFPLRAAKRQLFVDVTVTAENDLRTGIQRVVRSIVGSLIAMDLDEYRVEPVYLSSDGGRWHYRYARQWTTRLLGVDGKKTKLIDEPIDRFSGDRLLIADFVSTMLTETVKCGLFDDLRRDGVEVRSIVYDILPITLPSMFPDGVDVHHKRWAKSVLQLDGAVCISKSVADELTRWAKENTDVDLSSFAIDWFHLGADIDSSVPTKGLPRDYLKTISAIEESISFLMVGTIEPRKGYGQTLAAFHLLWDKGVDVNLVLVGKRGWMVDDLLEKIKASKEYNQKLLWLESISDEYLEKVYAASSCLIAASEGEGFGLPLIEAAQHKLPIMARDIPVFREVAGEHASFFNAASPEELAHSVSSWLYQYENNAHVKSDAMPWLSWKESATALCEIILGGDAESRQPSSLNVTSQAQSNAVKSIIRKS